MMVNKPNHRQHMILSITAAHCCEYISRLSTHLILVSCVSLDLNAPESMNMIPPIIAVTDLLCEAPSMKWVHFIPTVETSIARAERKRLSGNAILVA